MYLSTIVRTMRRKYDRMDKIKRELASIEKRSRIDEVKKISLNKELKELEESLQ